MAATLVLGTSAERRVGSSPTLGTFNQNCSNLRVASLMVERWSPKPLVGVRFPGCLPLPIKGVRRQ